MADSKRINPEGSDCMSTTPFKETVQPSYLRWAESMAVLLEDHEGVALFKQFLDQEKNQEKGKVMLEFLYACKGVKTQDDKTMLANIVTIIYKKYIRSNMLQLEHDLKQSLKNRYKAIGDDSEPLRTIYDEVCKYVEGVVEEKYYPSFIRSDLYVEYVQNGGMTESSPHDEEEEKVTDTRIPLAGPLPTLHEEEELRTEDCVKNHSLSSVIPLSSSALAVTQSVRNKKGGVEGAVFQNYHRQSTIPHHVSYAPVSERDSENTSDAYTTDDAMSHTDSSVDGRDGRCKNSKSSKSWVYKQKRRQLESNTGLNLQKIIPRTHQTLDPDRDLAATDPERFVAVLREKLETVVRERQTKQNLEKFWKMDERETKEEQLNRSHHYYHHSKQQQQQQQLVTSRVMPDNTINDSFTSEDLSMIFNKFINSRDNNLDTENILEEHMSRVFETPTRSPPAGHHPAEANTSYFGPNVSNANASTSAAGHVRGGLAPTRSYDSGIADACKFSNKVLYDDRPRRSRTSVVSAVTADSGVATDVPRVPNLLDPGNEKVMSWMLENEKCFSKNKSFSQSSSQKSGSRSSTKAMLSEGQSESSDKIKTKSFNTSIDIDKILMPAPALPPRVPINRSLHHVPLSSISTRSVDEPHKQDRSSLTSQAAATEATQVPVHYLLPGDQIPYRIQMRGPNPTLGQFKQQIGKKGHYKYFFKKVVYDDVPVVFEEITEDTAPLPRCDGKIVGKIERIEV